ncbi:MAG: hypothetical protein ABIN91_08430 [Mucilaginibacter sp.]|uniref:hypothetical protein n=1 Tax=Mucilaginibacter sp. TaxID=1882438 RepID=UPI0032675D9C
MDIIFNSLYKVDIETNDVTLMPFSSDRNDLEGYVKELVTNILDNSDRKGYQFKSDTTQVRNILGKILLNDRKDKSKYDNLVEDIAKRLLANEVSMQAKVEKLGVEILKGVLVVSLIKFDKGTSKIVISKADHNDFIDSSSYKKTSGLPLRKKIYKAFICEFDDKNIVTRTSVYDTNSTFSVYWWRDFLELDEVYTDEHNTESAFNVINSKILSPLKKDAKADYFNLWNTTVHYFRVKEEFSLDQYINDVIVNYRPFSPKVDVGDLVSKARNLPNKGRFDNRFKIVHGLLNKRFKNSIKLTDQIDLLLKQDISDLKNTIKPHEELDGSKWVMIKSEQGYEHFNNELKNNG